MESLPGQSGPIPTGAITREPDSLFECFPSIYAFFRERVFRDDTDLIVSSLWNEDGPSAGSQLLDLGCGPGFYARRLAGRYEQLQVTGIDRSNRQLHLARLRAAAGGLDNCRFAEADVADLPWPDNSVDALVASRLFMILPEPCRALAEMHRLLSPGGRCFIAEPRPTLRASMPLRTLWFLARLTARLTGSDGEYREPPEVMLYPDDEFDGMIDSQCWARTWRWRDRRYQYAVCEKGNA